MKLRCLICEQKKGCPSFCRRCIKKTFKERLFAIIKKGSSHSINRLGRKRYYSKIMRDKFGDEEGYDTTK